MRACQRWIDCQYVLCPAKHYGVVVKDSHPFLKNEVPCALCRLNSPWCFWDVGASAITELHPYKLDKEVQLYHRILETLLQLMHSLLRSSVLKSSSGRWTIMPVSDVTTCDIIASVSSGFSWNNLKRVTCTSLTVLSLKFSTKQT